VHSHLRTRGVDYVVDREYDYDGIFVGAALTVKVSPEPFSFMCNANVTNLF